MFKKLYLKYFLYKNISNIKELLKSFKTDNDLFKERNYFGQIDCHMIKVKNLNGRYNVYIGSSNDILKRLIVMRIYEIEKSSRLLKIRFNYFNFYKEFCLHLSVSCQKEKNISYRDFYNLLIKEKEIQDKKNKLDYERNKKKILAENISFKNCNIEDSNNSKFSVTSSDNDYDQRALNTVLMTAVG